jgi:serine protease
MKLISHQWKKNLLASAIAALAAGASFAEVTEHPTVQSETVQEIIVKPVDGKSRSLLTKDINRVAERYRVRMTLKSQHSNGTQLYKIDGQVSFSQAMSMANDFVSQGTARYAEPNRRLTKQETNKGPNDPIYTDQWYYFDKNMGIRLPGAWRLSKGKNVRVAVLDTGYLPHADLVDNLIPGYDFISDPQTAADGDGRDDSALDAGDGGLFDGDIMVRSSWHGLHVAGTVAAVTNNSVGVAGVAPRAKVMPVRVLGKGGGTLQDIADGITWATGGSVPGVPIAKTPAKIVNMSLGGPGECSPTMQKAIDGALERKAIVVVAAGNSASDVSGFMPANCKGVIAVAATGYNGGQAFYTNTGSKVDLAAPGGDPLVGVISTSNSRAQEPGEDNYEPKMGTSMAAPHVAGVVALMVAKNPNLGYEEVLSILKSTARPFPKPCVGCGSGIVNARNAVKAVSAPK